MKTKTLITKYFTFDYDNETNESVFENDLVIKRKLSHKEKKAGKVADEIGTVRFTAKDEFKCTDFIMNFSKELGNVECEDLLNHLTAFISGKDVVFIRVAKSETGVIADTLRKIGYADDIDGEPSITEIAHVVYEVPLTTWSWIYASLGMVMVMLLWDKLWGMCIGIALGFLIGKGIEEPERKARTELVNKRKAFYHNQPVEIFATIEDEEEDDDAE